MLHVQNAALAEYEQRLTAIQKAAQGGTSES
jgi:hypothetical protein